MNEYREPGIERYKSDKMDIYIFIAYCTQPIGCGLVIDEYINYIDINSSIEEIGKSYLEALEYCKGAKYYEGINEDVKPYWKVITKERSYKGYYTKCEYISSIIMDNKYSFSRWTNEGRGGMSGYKTSPEIKLPLECSAEEIGQAIVDLFAIPEEELPRG